MLPSCIDAIVWTGRGCPVHIPAKGFENTFLRYTMVHEQVTDSTVTVVFSLQPTRLPTYLSNITNISDSALSRQGSVQTSLKSNWFPWLLASCTFRRILRTNMNQHESTWINELLIAKIMATGNALCPQMLSVQSKSCSHVKCITLYDRGTFHFFSRSFYILRIKWSPMDPNSPRFLLSSPFVPSCLKVPVNDCDAWISN
jgi:hypothetical protein